jgi:site-specific DNA-cytosine methylase
MTKIRYLSLFSGIEAFSCAVKDMPEFEPVAFAEIEPFPCAVLAHHYPNVPNLGDVTKIDGKALRGKVDLIVGGSPCFVAGTMVLTPSGYRPIEELQVGDEVVSANGNIRKVEATGHKTASVGKLKILGRPEIVCTPNHPFLCFNVKRDDHRKSETYSKKIPAGEPWYVSAEKTVGMYACRGQWEQTAAPSIPDTLGASAGDIMELAGWYVGDGYIRRWKGKNKKAVVFALVNERKIQQFKDKFFYAIGAITKDGKVTVCSTSLAEWLIENFGEYSHAKRIPYWLYSDPLKHRFLEGYFATDGQDKGTHMRFTTTSQALALGIADLGRGNVEFTLRPPKHIIEGREVNQRNTYTVQLYTTETPRTKWFFDRWTSVVRSWTPLDEEQTVYNITVEEDHDYVANGFAVHNCQGFSVAGQRKGLDDERSCLALTFVRLVDEVRPKMWLWENVPGCTSTNGGQDLRSFFAALDDIGYSFAWTVLDSQYFGVAQRRRRVFAFGVLGTDWERCAKVLLEPESMCGDPPPRRKAGEGDSGSAEGGAGVGGEQGSVITPEADGGCATISAKWSKQAGGFAGDEYHNLVGEPEQNPTFATLCASGAGCDRPSAQGSQLDYLVQDVAFAQNQRDEVRQMEVTGALSAQSGMKQTTYVAQAEAVKKKTPLQTE